MRHAYKLAIVMSLGFTLITPTFAAAASAIERVDLQQVGQSQRVQIRWLNRYGPQPRVETLCSTPIIAGTRQALSPAACSALTQLRAQLGEPNVSGTLTKIRLYQLKRNRPIWSEIPWRDQRLLTQFDVLVLGSGAETEKATAPAK